MRKHFLHIFIVAVSFLFSCRPIAKDLNLDELHDKEEITGTLVVDVSYYKGIKVDRLLVNGKYHDPKYALPLNEPGYYRMEIFIQGSDVHSDPDVVRIVLLDEERGEAEWGLNKWTPLPPTIGVFDDRELTLIHPATAPAGVNIPLIVNLDGTPGSFSKAVKALLGTQEFYIKEGIGSLQIPPDESGGDLLRIDHRNFPVDIDLFDAPPLLLQDRLSADSVIPSGAYVRIGKDLFIPSGSSLIIHSGAFITIAPGINIHNEGYIQILGTTDQPVTFTCSEPDSFWGGIISTGQGNRIEASHCIFSQSGYHTGGDYSYGHAGRQALIYSDLATLDFTYCYMLDHAGQVFYPVSSSITISNCLIQRAMTGGQINSSELIIRNSVFTDFPDDSQDYQDMDNDALYLMGSNANISQSTFMYAKDDGLDSGGSSGGTIEVVNSFFKAIFHEGAALSSGGTAIKSHRFFGCTFTNCGQGLELGYSSPNHLVQVDSCFFHRNGIGIRYGDNYESRHKGRMLVSNSESMHNTQYDVWNMLRESWNADTLKMDFINVKVSVEIPMYPKLEIDEQN